MTGKRVVEVLERLKRIYGLPQIINCDNGSEFISRAVDDWAHRNEVKLDFSRPGKPGAPWAVIIHSSNHLMENCGENASTSTGLKASKKPKVSLKRGAKSIIKSVHIARYRGKRRWNLKRTGEGKSPSKKPLD